MCPAVAYDASGPFPRSTARIDWPAGYAWIPQIGQQAGYLVVRGMWLLGFFGSAKLEQALYRPSHKGSERRSGSFVQRAHAATPRPVAVSASLKGELSGLGVGSARKPQAPTQGPSTAVRGHPHENPGRQPKNRAVVVAVLLSRDCFGGTTHREVSALSRIPSLMRDKVIIVITLRFVDAAEL